MQLGALPEVIQTSIPVPVDLWRGLRTIHQHLACWYYLLSTRLFFLLFKKKEKSLTGSLPDWIETSSLRTSFLLYHFINCPSVLFLRAVY